MTRRWFMSSDCPGALIAVLLTRTSARFRERAAFVFNDWMGAEPN
jgi:hypothetical protein